MSDVHMVPNDEAASIAVAVLNSALEADRAAVSKLFAYRVECNAALRDHPTIQVGGGDKYSDVGVMGVINGLFGILPDGWGLIEAVWNTEGVPVIERFACTLDSRGKD